MNKFPILKDCCSFQEGYVNPSQKHTQYFGGNIKWLRASDLNGGHVYDTERKLSNEGYASAGISAKMFKKNTLAISKSGTIGALGILKNEMCGNRAVINIDVNPELADLMYVFYTLKYKKVELVSRAGGSIQKNLYISALETLKLNHADKSVQTKISEVLSALDGKIELNNRINAELVAMTKTLYDYWFVQFDFPNASGKPYKTSGGKMTYNPILKREIPESWSVTKLDDILSRTGTGLNPRDNFKLGDGQNYYITIKDIEQGKINFTDKSDRVNDDALAIIAKRSDLQKGDVLFTSIEPVGITYLIHEKPRNWDINESVFTIRANPSKVTSEFLFILLSGKELKSFTGNSSSGSIHKGIRHGVLKSYPFAYSGYSLIEKFTIVIKPMLEKQHNIENENLALINLRDWLLPMLMNGQVKVQ